MTKLCEIKSVGFGSGFVEDGLNCIAVDYRKFHFVFFTQFSLDRMNFASFAHCILFLGKSLTRYISDPCIVVLPPCCC